MRTICHDKLNQFSKLYFQQAQHSIIPAGVAYLQAPYHDELSDFRITPSPGGPMLDHRFQDDSANMVYGYVSSPYGTTNPAGNFNCNNFS